MEAVAFNTIIQMKIKTKITAATTTIYIRVFNNRSRMHASRYLFA